MEDFREKSESDDESASNVSFGKGNINRGTKIVPTPLQFAKLQSGSALDMELYAYAKAKFEADFTQMRAAQAIGTEDSA